MFASFIITLREGLEAALIIGIILAYLNQTKHIEYNKYVYIGTFMAIVASFAAAIAFILIAGEFEGRNEEIFEGTIMLFASVVLTSMIIWMYKQSTMIRGRIEQRMDLAISSEQVYVLATLAFVSVFREGAETVLFLGAASTESSKTSILLGSTMGIITSIVLALLIFKSSARISIKKFFQITAIILIVFAAGLTAQGVHELQEAGIIPILREELWNINDSFMNEKSTLGNMLKSLLGYNGNPSLLEVIAYISYYILVFFTFINIKRENYKSKIIQQSISLM